MCISATLISLAIGAAGAATSAYSGKRQASEQKKAVAQSQRQEALRAQQMRLEAQQKDRQMRREEARASAIANANTSAKIGSGASESSAYGGGLGGIVSNFAFNRGVLNQSTSIGQSLFDSNAAEAGYLGQAASWNQMGQFGQSLFAMAPSIGQLAGAGPGQTAQGGDPMQGWGENMTVIRPVA